MQALYVKFSIGLGEQLSKAIKNQGQSKDNTFLKEPGPFSVFIFVFQQYRTVLKFLPGP